MGEYAKFGNSEIKIGTCEDMYYLRFEDRYKVRHLPGNVDPNKDSEAAHLRFRLPFPDEDHILPGGYEPETNWKVYCGIDFGAPNFAAVFLACVWVSRTTGVHGVCALGGVFLAGLVTVKGRLWEKAYRRDLGVEP